MYEFFKSDIHFRTSGFEMLWYHLQKKKKKKKKKKKTILSFILNEAAPFEFKL